MIDFKTTATEMTFSPKSGLAIPTSWDDLPLAPFERFLLGNDAPEHPMVFRVLMHFDGEPNAELLSRAFEVAISRQPLLRSRIAGSGQDAVWKLQETVPELEWISGDSSIKDVEQLPIEPIDLRSGVGVRCRVCAVESELTLLLDIHHACCDGQGARQFLGEWLSIYSQLVQNGEYSLVPLAYDQLKKRGQYRKPQPPIGTWEGLRNLYLTLRGRTVQLPRNGTLEPGMPVDWAVEETLSVEETVALRNALRRKRITINDAALTASFLTFVERFPDLSTRNYLTLLHPVDLRWPSDLKTPACNRVGISFLRRKYKDCLNARQLLQSLQGEMKYIKRRYVGAEFLRGLSAAGELFGGTQRIQSWGWFIPTFQFTCLGDTTRALRYRYSMEGGAVSFGGLRVQKIAGFMQLGPFVPLSLAACETSQRISFTLRAAANCLDQTSARLFLETFREKFREIAIE